MKLSFLFFGFQQLVEAQFPGRYAHEMVSLHRELKQGTVLNHFEHIQNLNFDVFLPSHDLVRVGYNINSKKDRVC